MDSIPTNASAEPKVIIVKDPIKVAYADTAILLVNGLQMNTRSLRHHLDMAKVTFEDQQILATVYSQTYSYEGEAPTMALVDALSKILNKAPDAIDRRLRKLEKLGYLVQVQNEDRGNVHHWYLNGPTIRKALEAHAETTKTIARVIEIQSKDPENPKAGSDLLHADIYYNVVANHHERRLAKAAKQSEKTNLKNGDAK